MSHGGGGAGNGVSPGNVPVCYYGAAGRVPASLERRVRATELFMRCAACGLAVLAAALLGADRQTRSFFSVEKEARFTDMQSLVFLVIANGMAACYSLLQGARCLVSILTGGVLINRPMAWAIFSCDQGEQGRQIGRPGSLSNTNMSVDLLPECSSRRSAAQSRTAVAVGDGVLHDLGGGRGDGGGDDRQVRVAAVPVDEDVPPLQAFLRAGGWRFGLRRGGQPEHGRHLAGVRVQPLPVVRQRQRQEVIGLPAVASGLHR